MRAYFRLTANTEPVKFDYQHDLVGVLHRLLGTNEIHDAMSLYSFSWLDGGMREGDALNFPRGASWFVSAFDDGLICDLAKNALQNKNFIYGMQLDNVRIVNTPEFHSQHRFKVASPVLAKCKMIDGQVKHLVYSEEGSNDILTQTLKHKMDAAGLSKFTDGVKVSFDASYDKAKTKLVNIKDVSSRASMCPVIVKGSKTAIQFAWNVGIGNSTGCGFGALR